MKKGTMFALGALLGGGAALLLTPKSGKELQGELLQRVDELQQKVKEFDQESFKVKCKNQLEEIKKMIDEFDWNRSIQQDEENVKQVTSRLDDLTEEIEEYEEEEQNELCSEDSSFDSLDI